MSLIRPSRRRFITGAAATLILPAQAKSQIFGVPVKQQVFKSSGSVSLTIDETWNNQWNVLQGAPATTVDLTLPVRSIMTAPLNVGIYNVGQGADTRVVMPIDPAAAPINRWSTDTVCGNPIEWYIEYDGSYLFAADMPNSNLPSFGGSGDNTNWTLPGKAPHWGRQPDASVEIPSVRSDGAMLVLPPGVWSSCAWTNADGSPGGWQIELSEMLQSGSSQEEVEFQFSVMSTAQNDRIMARIRDDYGIVAQHPGDYGVAMFGSLTSSFPVTQSIKYKTPGGFLQSIPTPDGKPNSYRTLKPNNYVLELLPIYGLATLGAGNVTGTAQVKEWAVA